MEHPFHCTVTDFYGTFTDFSMHLLQGQRRITVTAVVGCSKPETMRRKSTAVHSMSPCRTFALTTTASMPPRGSVR